MAEGSRAPASAPAAPPYRPDIDGLRALAVIAVILFHSGVPGIAGGYAGVDVFFVISGYLITQLLEGARGQPAGRTLATFYLRRMRRILPALLLTCFVTAIAGVTLLVPIDLVYLGKYLAATAVLLSNLASWSDGSYFGPWTPYLPLSHLWSIAVEEQFYLLYPLALLAISCYLPRQRRLVLLTLAVASFALCLWASRHKPGANYFFAPTRAWELLLGALLALGAVPPVRAGMAKEGLAAAGLVGIAVAVHIYDSDTPYPGFATLLPCAATAALIASGRQPGAALVNRLLAWRPLVLAGLVSYSLYLWHRPLLAFAGYYHITPLPPAAVALLLAALALIAFLSWRFIEQPVRSRVVLRTPRALLAAAALGSLALLAAGLALWNSKGWPQRFPPPLRALLGDLSTAPALVECMRRPLEDIASGLTCQYVPHDPGRGAMLVWGDSHTLALMPAYEQLAEAHRMHVYVAAKSSCLPVLPPAAAAATRSPGEPSSAADACSQFNAAVAAAISRLAPSLVIMAARWVPSELPRSVGEIAAGIEDTARAIGDGERATCIVLTVPTLKYPATYALVMARRRHIADDFLALSRDDAVAPYRDMERAVRALGSRGVVRVADPKDILCPAARCRYEAGGHALYWDDNHLSEYGAHFVAAALEPCFADAARTTARSDRSD